MQKDNDTQLGSFTLWNVDFGEDEAKGDPKLEQYFVPIPEIERIVSGKYRYIIGRKGTGKTAILEKLRLEAERRHDWNYSTLSLRNFPLPLIRDLRDKSLRDKSQFVPIWKFLILIEVCNLIIADEGAGPASTKMEIHRFLETNFGDQVSFVETVNLLHKNSQQVSILPSWLGGQSSKGTERNAATTIHYEKAADLLIKLIGKISSSSLYFIFMDELDEGFRAGDTSLRLILLALLRAVEETHLTFKESRLSIRPLLALRADIFDHLEDNDLNKLHESIIRLSWLQNGTTGYTLRDIVDARIRASAVSRGLPQISDPWTLLVKDRDAQLPSGIETIWKYIVNRTFERPRDVIKFLKCCQKCPAQLQVDFKTVEGAEIAYSQWLHDEVRDEIHSYLPVWRESFQCLSRIGKGVLTLSELRIELGRDPEIAAWMKNHNKTPEFIASTLFDFSVIGNLDHTKRWLFKYKDPDISWSSAMKIILHFGFHRKLRLRRH